MTRKGEQRNMADRWLGIIHSTQAHISNTNVSQLWYVMDQAWGRQC
jgi:hypothetical protein